MALCLVKAASRLSPHQRAAAIRTWPTFLWRSTGAPARGIVRSAPRPPSGEVVLPWDRRRGFFSAAAGRISQDSQEVFWAGGRRGGVRRSRRSRVKLFPLQRETPARSRLRKCLFSRFSEEGIRLGVLRSWQARRSGTLSLRRG